MEPVTEKPRPAHPHAHHPPLRLQPGEHVPRLVFWETTAGCNLECIHCRRLDVARELMKNDLSTGEAMAFINSLAEAGKPILVLSGGEPLFRPDILHLAAYASGRGLPVALSTNGTLVGEEMAERICGAGIRRVSISIDGADETTHDGFRRQPGSLKAALAGFRRLRSRGMSMQINTTITRHNVHQIDDFYRMALDLGADSMHFFMLVPVGCGVQIAESNMLDAATYERVLHWLFEKSLEGKMHCKAVCAPHYYRIMRQEAARRHIPLSHSKHGMEAITKGCLAGTAICFVSHEGEVFPCGYLPMSSGNVRRTPFQKIWSDSPIFAALRDDGNLKGKCGACEFKHVCMGCRARAHYDRGDYLAEEPYCDYVPAVLRPAAPPLRSVRMSEGG